MHADFDLIIRSGSIHDGTGAPGYIGDVGIRDGRICEVGTIKGHALEEIDATDLVVTPGFVDIHTHYDGQAIWADQLTPSSWHGVTTAVMGNCGVGFAPCRAEDRDDLIELMEGVEDIPDAVMHEGLTWQWETFEQYLQVLEQTPRDMDVCALLPHAPLRVYVMGARALRLEPATSDDVARMRQIVASAVTAGAFGVSTSRSTSHRGSGGALTPTLLAREQEINGLLMGMSDAGRGIFQLINEMSDADSLGEYDMVRRGLARSGRPGIFSLFQAPSEPEHWRTLLDFADAEIDGGVSFRPVVAPRALGVLLGLEASRHPLDGTATYRSMAALPLPERVARMRDSEVRQRMLTDDPMEFNTWKLLERIPHSGMFRCGTPPNYVPDKADSVAAIAQREGREPGEVIYDMLLEDDGMGFIYVPFANFVSGDLSACGEMLDNRNTLMGLGDGGAHSGFLLDAGFPTWLLRYWVKEKGRFSLAEGVRRLTSDPADAIGLTDRGRIEVGLRADINVIDMDRLGFGAPYVERDLPANGKRLLQRGEGYEATIVAGTVTYRNGNDTGARPGTLVRSGRQ
jgi:N-acyl-D-aspartate/D-glutamate deacylase